MDEFALRRSKIMGLLNQGPIILPAGRTTTRNNDVEFEFRQSSPFWYLTGFGEPNAVIVLRPGDKQPFCLFVQPSNPKMETWTGIRTGVEGAKKVLSADLVWSIDELEKQLPKLMNEFETIYYPFGTDVNIDRLITKTVIDRRRNAQRGYKSIVSLIDPLPAIDSMRLVKSKFEIENLKKAIEITTAGFDAAFRATNDGVYEYEIQSELEYEFRRGGSQRNGYPSIVASGSNACILHYTSNQDQVRDGDLLLIDAGAEYGFYSADITRTWPINGKFSAQQRDVYEIVLASNKAGIKAARPGIGIDEVHQASVKVLTQGLIDLNVLKGNLDDLVQRQEYLPYFMHGTSHWLGLDVHDPGGRYRTMNSSSKPTKLQPSMVLTIEPGLYFGRFAEKTPEHLKGIGIRIEDNVSIVDSGNIVLTDKVPKDIKSMETAVGRGFKNN